MSRTKGHIRARRNDRYNNSDFEYNDDFVKSYYERPFHGRDIPTGWDESYTTYDKTESRIRDNRRHPNKSKRTSLGREFSQTNIGHIKTNPYGDVYDRSYRLRKVKYLGKKLRRTRLKKFANDIVTQELGDC